MKKMMLLMIAALSMPALAARPLPTDSIESIRVHELVDQMQRAIDRLDRGRYMSLIDTSDAVLATEQRAWFADLGSHPVEDLTLSINTQESPIVLDEDGVIAPLEISWRIPSEEDTRHYLFPARMVPVGAENGQWVFAGRAWEVHQLGTPGVRVYSDKQHEQAALLAEQRVPVLRDTIANDMGIELENSQLREVVVKIYPSMNALQASIYPSYSDPLSGWNEPGESIKILGREKIEQDRLDPLLGHEIGHAVSFEFGPEINNAPWWTLEGIAEVSAGLFRDSWERKNKRIVRMAKSDNLRDWSLLADFRGEANNHAMHVYLQGWSMIDYIDRVFGIDQRNAWFTRLGHGDTLDQATRSTLNIGFDDLDLQWRQSLLESNLDENKDESKSAD